jgi:glutamate/tyrosine decarboxylase-like PLP-dependent enzyme
MRTKPTQSRLDGSSSSSKPDLFDCQDSDPPVVPTSISSQSPADSEAYVWPEHAMSDDDITSLIEEIKTATGPYDRQDKTPISYPGTHPDAADQSGMRDVIPKLTEQQINLIGTHTQEARDRDSILKRIAQYSPESSVSKATLETIREGESGFEEFQEFEARAIWTIASVIGGKSDTVDGFFCGGGTEANLQGMWIGREWLRQRPDPMGRGIVVLTTPLTHYSIHKAAEILDLGRSQLATCTRCMKDHIFLPDRRGCGVDQVGMDTDGQMSIDELAKLFQQKYDEGFRLFLVIPTAGTSVMGSIDPIKQIAEFVRHKRQSTSAYFYIHVDAAFGGFTIPFFSEAPKIGFEHDEVMSIALDADKMGQMPYPAGIFLCRKGLQRLVERQINYIRGHVDDTVPGSRSALPPVLALVHYRAIGREGQRKYVKACLDLRDDLARRIDELFSKAGSTVIRSLPYSKWVNILPLEINLEDGAIPERLLEEDLQQDSTPPEWRNRMPLLSGWHLRSDLVPTQMEDVASCPRTVYKVIIMPHVTVHMIENFVNALKLAFEFTSRTICSSRRAAK